jgi:hypothetical protein
MLFLLLGDYFNNHDALRERLNPEQRQNPRKSGF